MNLDLTGKRALVCGSSQGMGKAIAIELADQGAKITLFARNEDRLKSALADLSGEGHDYLVADFDNLESVKAQVKKGLTSGDYHILINNSGGPAPGALHQADLDALELGMSRHLKVSHSIVKEVLDGMKSANYGRIINIISTSVRIPIPNLGVSNTVRGAMASWSKTLANELGQFGVTVNNILPGFINTARIDSIVANKSKAQGKSEAEIETALKSTVPLGRFGEPEEIAAYAAFLCSQSGGYISGTSLRVDGGRTGSI